MPLLRLEILKYLIPALLVAVAALFLISLPQGREEEPVVPVDISSPLFMLKSGESITQTLLATGQPINGLKIFSPLKKLDGQILRAEIYDTNKIRLTKSYSLRTEYPTGFLSIILDTKPITTTVKQPLIIKIINRGNKSAY